MNSTRLNVNQQIGDIKPFSILLNGPSFAIIENDSYLLSHFIFILFFSTSVVGYNLSQLQKAHLIKIIKKSFPGNKRVMAVGSCLNDIEMFSQADFGILIEKEEI